MQAPYEVPVALPLVSSLTEIGTHCFGLLALIPVLTCFEVLVLRNHLHSYFLMSMALGGCGRSVS